MDKKVLNRLEVAVVRLESLSGGSQPQTVASASSEPSIVAFDDLIAEYVSKVSAAAEKIGGHVKDITNVVSDAFRVQKELLAKIKQTQKPDAAGMVEFLRPLNEKLTEAHTKAGSHSDFTNHLKSTAESLTALAWIAYTGKDCGMSMPIGHVEECWQSAEFYSNKVLVEYKNKDSNHVEWAKALKELYLPGLRDYVKSHYPLGPVWSATGVSVTVTAPSKSSKPGAPAAPNPPSSSLASSSSSSSSKQGLAAVFQEISSKPVTAGLKKVTNDMKTKNRTDRAGLVSSGVKEANKSVPSGAKVGPPKLELVMGRKWVVEYQISVKDLCINECDPKQTVYIFGCKDSVLQIKGKVNNITVDKCTKMGVVFTDVVAAFEIVNCSSIEVQCQGAAPTISIDNTAGCQLYLSKDSLGSSITTSKASEVNVMVPSEDPNADLVEHALPHQYIHTHQDHQFVTTPVLHSGGVSTPKTNSDTEIKTRCLTSDNAQKTNSDLGNKAKCLTVNNAPKTDANMEIKTRSLTVNNAQKTNSDTGNKNKTNCLTVNEAQKTDTGMGSKTNCVTTDMRLYYMAALLCIIFAMVVAFMLSS